MQACGPISSNSSVECLEENGFNGSSKCPPLNMPFTQNQYFPFRMKGVVMDQYPTHL